MALGIGVLFFVPLVAKATIDVLTGDVEKGEGIVSQLGLILLGNSSGGWLLLRAFFWVIGLTALGGFFLFLRGVFAAKASEGIVRRLRDHLFGHLSRLPCSYYDKADTGDLVQRCTSDVETLRLFLSGQVIEIGRAVLLVAWVLPLMLGLHLWLTLFSLILLPVLVLFAYLFFGKTKRLFQEADEAEGAMTTVLQENLTGIRVVRAFARQEFECEKFGKRNRTYREKVQKHIHLLAVYWSTSDLIAMTQSGLVLFGGIHYVQTGAISVGTLFAFLTFEAQLMWPMRLLGRVLSEAGKAMVSLQRLRAILVEPEEGAEAPFGMGSKKRMGVPLGVLARLRGEIRVEGLGFAYPDGTQALEDLSFEVEPGETIALLGAPGSGKSTLIQLFLRLYEPTQGRILLDGKPLQEMERSGLRSQISVVLQEPFLFSRSIAFNLRVGRTEAEDHELHEASRMASIHETIEEFDAGYQTMLGERGVNLSGGQRQRLSIARALLRDTPLLILDDALSAVDSRTEGEILSALRRRARKRTTILIAHRLSTLQQADRIFVLDKGRLVQTGTHEELRAKEGIYQRLWGIQERFDAELIQDLDGRNERGLADSSKEESEELDQEETVKEGP
jgi:ATP-binding cassette subfamily B protein